MRASATLVLSLAMTAFPNAARAQAPARPDPFALIETAAHDYQRRSAGMCQEFRQTLTVPLLGEDRVGKGRLCSRAPGHFAMRFTEPAGDLLVADGTWFWMYTPSTDTRQVIRWRLAQGPRGVDLYREFLESPRTKYRAEYRGREAVEGKPSHRIVLTPVSPAPYKTADLWIDAETPQLRQVRITEENGSVRTVTLGASAPPSDSFFRFTPPAGTQVISR